jgi:hypothetical protein
MRVFQSDILLARLDLDLGNFASVEETSLRVLQQSQTLDLIQPEVEAMELLGDLRVAEGDLAGASTEYASALERVRQSTWSGMENTLSIKQANVLMDLDELAVAAPLIGALSGQQASVSSLKAQARFAYLNGDDSMALKLMDQARNLAGKNWDEESEAIYQSYHNAP